ncbi:uncharacterized protein LOC112037216 [Quercus suber]|uniref:uncharacterized protein LOC112037216 n=1 Tax=Quercus suber TaxID=58331 RepID=UPI000CE27852|nr:uncharacterized protein LOC112037216 [Quercus suber]
MIGHLFWECNVAKELWTLSDIPLKRTGIIHRSFMDLIWYLPFKQHMDTTLIELVVTITWSAWFNRNKTRLGEARQTLQEILRRARFILHDFQLAHLRPIQLKEAIDGCWVQPVFPWYKVNIDAAVFSQLGIISVGVIIRDHLGSVVATLSKCLPLPLDPLEVEAKAIDEATIFAWDIGIRDVIFESDSLQVCHAMENPMDVPISISTVVSGFCSRLPTFRTFQSSHVRQQGNRPAHTLAAFAKNIDSFLTWMEECPPLLASLVSQDAM